MTEHTPGPWFAVSERLYQGKHHVAGRGPVVKASGRPRTIAEVYRATTQDGREKEAEANARLIAAAPELYEALQDCVALLSGEVSGAAQVNSILRESRAAIAKVEGAALSLREDAK